MFYYVEYLRAKRALRVAAIILGLLLVAAIVLRLSLSNYTTMSSYAGQYERMPGAVVQHRTLADGTRETVVDVAPRHIHAVIDEAPRKVSVSVSEPASQYNAVQHHGVLIGSETVHMAGGMAHETVNYEGDSTFDISSLFGISMIMALIVGTMLAAPLTKENDGHLDLAWTKPFSRSSYALGAIGVDAAAILISQIMMVVTLVLGSLLFLVPEIKFGSAAQLATALIGPIAWYALLTTIGASLKRGPGLVIGMGWICAIVVGSVSAATAGSSSPVGIAVHKIFQVLAYFDPIAYMSTGSGASQGNGVITTATESALVLLVLAIVYIASAVLQWRRVEA